MPDRDAPEHMVFKLRHMEVFRAVMLTGSISSAARMLYVSQPAVSKLITYIESRLAFALFNRVNNRLVPTAQAHTLYREVERVYQAALQVNECALALAASPSHPLRLCCSGSLSTVVLPGALAELKRQVPSMKIEWQATLISDMPQQLLGNKVDLAISALPVLHDHLHSQAFMEGHMVCAMPQGHPLADCNTVDFSDLTHVPLLMFRADGPFGKLINQVAEQAGTPLASVLEFTNALEGVGLVKQGMGVTIIDEFVARDSGLVVRPLTHDIRLDISFVYSKFAPLPEPALRMMRVLREQARRQGRALAGPGLPGNQTINPGQPTSTG